MRRSLRVKVAGTLAALITALTVGIGASPAHAIMDACVLEQNQWSLSELNPWKNPSGSNGVNSIVGRDFTTAGAGAPGTYFYGATGYEWFGGNNALGLSSDQFIDEQGDNTAAGALPMGPAAANICASDSAGWMSNSVNRSGTWLWDMALSLNSMASSLLEMSQSATVITWFADTIIKPFQQGADTNGDGTPDGNGLNQFYWTGLAAVVVFSVGYLMMLIAKQRIKMVGKELVWIFAAVVVGSVTLANPLLLPTMTQFGIEKLGNGLSMIGAKGVSGLLNEDPSASMCNLSDSVNYPDGSTLDVSGTKVTLPSKDVRMVTCEFWQATALSYYREAQFGTREPVIATEGNAASWQVKIPGLTEGTGPKAGDLVALNLATRNLDPAEQRWVEKRSVEEGVPTNAQVVQTPLYGGNGTSVNKQYVDDPAAVYPATDIYAGYDIPVDAGTLNSAGHQTRLENLTWAMGQQSSTVFGTYTGAGAGSVATRVNGTVGLGLTSISSTGGVAIFSGLAVMYQFFIGIMALFLPLALVGMALPMRWGKQIAKDYFSKWVENALLASMAMAFAVLSLYVTVAIPQKLPIGADSVPVLMAVIGGMGLLALLFAWRKVVKGFRSKVPAVMGANDRTMWDVGTNVTEKAGKVAKVAGVAGVAVAAGALTGGTAGAVVAAKATGSRAVAAAVNPGSTLDELERGNRGAIRRHAEDVFDVHGRTHGEKPGAPLSLDERARQAREEKKRQRAEKAGRTYGTPATPDVPVSREEAPAAEMKAPVQRMEDSTVTQAPTGDKPRVERESKIIVPGGDLPAPRRTRAHTESDPEAGPIVRDRRASTAPLEHEAPEAPEVSTVSAEVKTAADVPVERTSSIPAPRRSDSGSEG